MRAIIAILPLAGLLCLLNPAPADFASGLSAGFKSPSDMSEARSQTPEQTPDQASTLFSILDAAVEGLTHNSAGRTANHNTQPAATLLVDSTVVR